MHKGNLYSFAFAAAVCVVCSALLSVAAVFLQPMQEKNAEVNRKRNILLSAGIKAEGSDSILSVYDKRISRAEKELEIYRETGPDGGVGSYIFPVSGKGLWSTIKAYISIKPDGNTVNGITFYEHGETPGLGGEIEQKWFRDNFKGKKLFNENGKFESIAVVKGEAEGPHEVDGISGATMTGNGVSEFLKNDLGKYKDFLSQLSQEIESAEGEKNR